MSINLVKGTHDIINDEAELYSHIEDVCKTIAQQFGFNEFRTPIIENTELFCRSVGDSTDIVRKEMYTFEDKGGRSITLRPEITAGTIRSMVNNKLHANQDFPIKAFYCGPTFRYERPQQGRYRQFNQFGVECVGVTNPYQDAEVLILLYKILSTLGFDSLTISLNSLGDKESRNNYKNALREYFAQYIDGMCEDCKERFNINVLRILDCKNENDKKIIENAPKIQDYLSDKSLESFKTICGLLDSAGIPYEIDSNLVRGLDYYSELVFEINYVSKAGKNYGALGGGGHYSDLFKEIGGPSLEGVGFALGVERLYSVMQDDGLFDEIKTSSCDVYVMPLKDVEMESAFHFANLLRFNDLRVDICYEGKSLPQMFKKAERRKAKLGIILGMEEINQNKIIVRNLIEKTQETIDFDDLLEYIDNFLMNYYVGDVEEEHEGCCCGHHHDHEEGHCCNHHSHDEEDGEEHHCCCGHKHSKDKKCEC